MKKKRAIRNFIILAILLLICFIFSFVSFRIPTTVDRFAGFVNGIYLSKDFNGGVTATYTVTYDDNFNGDEELAVSKAMARVESLVARDYGEYYIEKVDSDKICVTIPKISESTTIKSNYLVNFITFTTESVSDPDEFTPTFTGANITEAKYFTSNGAFGTLISFNDAGKQALLDMADGLSSTGTLYIYQDKDYSSVLLRISVDSNSLTTIANNNQIFISDVSIFPTKDNAVEFADKIASGMLNVDMSLEGSVSIITPTFGEGSTTIIGIIMILLIVLSVVYLVFRYKALALPTAMSMLCFVALSLIIMPIFESIQVSFAGFIGLAIIYILTYVAHIIYLEKARNDFASGKKLLASFKSAYVKSVLANTDMYVVVFMLSLASALIAMGAMKTVAIILAILVFPSALCSMLIHRGLVKWYLDINPTKYKKINFEKGGLDNEE